MNRAILAFHQDDGGDWVAELSCLHAQHVRHASPFRVAPWVLDDAHRAARVGSPLDCPLCDRTELPDGLRVVRSTELWDEHTVPAALRRAHRLSPGVWGRLQVQHGRLRFWAQTEPPLELIVGPEQPQGIPPEVEHHVERLAEVRFLVECMRR